MTGSLTRTGDLTRVGSLTGAGDLTRVGDPVRPTGSVTGNGRAGRWQSVDMRVGILGPLEVTVDGRPVRIGGARLRALLVRLAMDAGRMVSVEALTRGLWADGAPSDPGHAIQSLVSRLRRALPGTIELRSVAGGYCLAVPPDAVDALRFERLAKQGRLALRAGDRAGAAALLREALGLWRGEPFADVADAPFSRTATARLEQLRLTALEDRIEADLAEATEPTDLVVELATLVDAYPLRERLRALHLRALHADGRQTEALTVFEQFRARLADELGTDPGPELRQAHLAVLRGEREPGQADPQRPAGNLRLALTSFVSRAAEREQLARQLAVGRLVTLVGAGGAGKTRLATAVAADLAPGAPGGVWLVELATVTDPADIAHAIIGALGLRGAGPLDVLTSREAVSRIVDALSGSQALIVLDNCEHMIEAAARLVDDLLGHCPGLRVLATSREPLGVAGEALCPVRPFEVPAAEATVEQAAASPAVRLFLDRAAAARPDFTLTETNVAAVVEICRRLDGLPLGIELAAARLRSLSVEQVAARLDDRFQLLTGGSRTALPRHRTLHAVMAWSWDLLEEPERRLARHLAVYPGGVTLEIAEGVVAAGPAAGSALDLVTALVDKSLLQPVDGPEPRYRMLETIREYGLEQLAQTAEMAEARTAHAEYFLRLAQTSEPHLRRANQLAWIGRLAAERENFLAALHFACDTGDAATAVRLAAALGYFWTLQGSHADAMSWLRLALDVPGPVPAEAREVATAAYALNAVLSGSTAEAAAEAGRLGPAASGASRAGRGERHPVGLLNEPAWALVVDDTARGIAAVADLLPAADPWSGGMLRLIRALLNGNRGDLDAMRTDLAAAVEAFRAAGERWGLATSLMFLADRLTIAGELDGAVAALAESITVLQELDPADGAVAQRVLLAMARAYRGDVSRARADLSDLLAAAAGRPTGYPLVYARISLGTLARFDGDLAEAARQYRTAAADLRGVRSSPPQIQALLSAAMSHALVAREELAEAAVRLAEAYRMAASTRDLPIVAVVAVAMADLGLARGSAGEAAEVLGAAHALRGAADAHNPDVARIDRALRERLGERGYRTAYARGARLGRETALALIEAQTLRSGAGTPAPPAARTRAGTPPTTTA